MRYLIDTNVLSEPTKPLPHPGVTAWLRANERSIVVNPIILGELRFGILLLPKGKRRNALENWLNVAVHRIQCIPWDAETGIAWAGLLARLRAAGNAMPVKDSLIAATALRYDLMIVTRNEADFRHAGVPIINPFVP